MKLPSKIIDISMPLDNETVVDPPIMRPQIKYVSNKENADMMCAMLPGLKPSDLPDGEAWSWEVITLTTHNGTHMDAPSISLQHGQRYTIDGPRSTFRPGIKPSSGRRPHRESAEVKHPAIVQALSRSTSSGQHQTLIRLAENTSAPRSAWDERRRDIAERGVPSTDHRDCRRSSRNFLKTTAPRRWGHSTGIGSRSPGCCI